MIIEKSRVEDAGNYSCNIENNPVEMHPFEAWGGLK